MVVTQIGMPTDKILVKLGDKISHREIMVIMGIRLDLQITMGSI